MLALALLAVLAAAPASPAPLPGATSRTDLKRFCDAGADELPGLIASIAALPDARARVLSATERFLGVPYQFDALGEGPGNPPDEDPRLRWDLADCQSLVETAVALTRARSAEELLPLLDDVRYEAAPTYPGRNHVFEAQWVPVNVRKGWIKDVTAAVGGKDLATHTKELTRQGWDSRVFAEKLVLPDERIPLGRWTVSYVPLAKVLAHAKDIPSGTIFAIVRADQPRVPTMISHLGFVVQKPGGTYLRHAGRDLYMSVVDEEMAHLVARNLTYKKWPVLGLAFYEVLDRPAAKP